MTSEYKVSNEQLIELSKSREISALEQLGGINGLVESLNTKIDTGLGQDDTEKRKTVFGENVLPEPPTTSYFILLKKMH